MSTGLTGTSSAGLQINNINTMDLSEVKDALSLSDSITWTYGTGVNQVNILYHDKVTIGDGANTILNLFDSGSLLDAFGVALTLTAIKALYIKNNSSDAILLVGGGADADLLIFAATSDIIKIQPGGSNIWQCPTAAGVIVSTNKNLKLEHDGTGSSDMDVDIAILGLD